MALSRIAVVGVLWFLISALPATLSAHAANPPAPKGQFTNDFLKQCGNDWQQIKQDWADAQRAHGDATRKIDTDPNLTPAQKADLKQLEAKHFDLQNKGLAKRRDDIQKVLIQETNSRLGKSTSPTSDAAKQTAGTKIDDPGHRGMAGDMDAGAGGRTTEKMKDVLKDMGIYDPKRNPGFIKETLSTIEMGDGFEMTVNKTGLADKPGSDFHNVQTKVDAHNKETYISEGMKTRGPDGKVTSQQAGADYVTVQDHKKKAISGLNSSGDELVRHPDKMQSMVKGANKTLGDAGLSDAELSKVLKQNGIKDSPADFRKKLDHIKEGKLTVTDPADAAKIRDVADGVFATGERKTLVKSQAEMSDLRKQIAAADAAGNKAEANRLREKYVDSKVKMEETHLANNEKLNRSANKIDVDPPPKPTAEKPTTKPGGPGPDAPGGAKAKVLETVGTIMVISDIGNACDTLEKYLSGEISGKEAAETLVDQTLTLGLIGAGKKTANSWSTYWDINKSLQDTNKQNLANYFTQWEIQLRKAGMSAEEARRRVGEAMISGDTSGLTQQANELRDQGKGIRDPKLVIETFDYGSGDYLNEVGEQIVEAIQGIGMGLYTGGMYIVTAPSRVVEAWAQGELAEAELEFQSASQEAWMKARLFQRLLKSGIPPRDALRALNDYFGGEDMSKLRDIFRKIRGQKHGGYVTSHHSQKDWYCTNRPEINAPVALPPILNRGPGGR